MNGIRRKEGRKGRGRWEAECTSREARASYLRTRSRQERRSDEAMKDDGRREGRIEDLKNSVAIACRATGDGDGDGDGAVPARQEQNKLHTPRMPLSEI